MVWVYMWGPLAWVVIWAVVRPGRGVLPAVGWAGGGVWGVGLMPGPAPQTAREPGGGAGGGARGDRPLEARVPCACLALTHAHENVRLGSAYLRKLIDSFQGNVPLALAAYNAGPQAVGRWLAAGESLPLDLFVARIPYEETRGYVARVLSNAARYAYLE